MCWHSAPDAERLAELHFGALVAPADDERARRVERLGIVEETFDPLLQSRRRRRAISAPRTITFAPAQVALLALWVAELLPCGRDDDPSEGASQQRR